MRHTATRIIVLLIAAGYWAAVPRAASRPAVVADTGEDYARDDSAILADVYTEMTARCIQQRRYGTALEYARKAWNLTPRHSAEMTQTLAQCYMMNDSLEQAERLLVPLLATGDNPTRYAVYRRLLWIANARSDQNHIVRYADSACHYLERIYQQTMEENVAYNEANRRMEAEAVRMRHRIALRSWMMGSAFVVLLILCVAAWMVHRSTRQAARRQLAYEREKQRLQQAEITHREAQIARLRKSLLGRIDLVRRIDEKRKADRKMTFLPEEWADMELLLDETYDNYVKRLRQAYPSLSEKDLRFCMLIRMGFSNHDLTNVYMISETSMKQKLFDFKAKLALTDPAVSLRHYLNEF